jgi:hypothetical protein
MVRVIDFPFPLPSYLRILRSKQPIVFRPLSSMEAEFGEHITPARAIKQILDSYPFSVGLFRELLQNSDDARATEQVCISNALLIHRWLNLVSRSSCSTTVDMVMTISSTRTWPSAKAQRYLHTMTLYLRTRTG